MDTPQATPQPLQGSAPIRCETCPFVVHCKAQIDGAPEVFPADRQKYIDSWNSQRILAIEACPAHEPIQQVRRRFWLFGRHIIKTTCASPQARTYPYASDSQILLSENSSGLLD